MLVSSITERGNSSAVAAASLPAAEQQAAAVQGVQPQDQGDSASLPSSNATLSSVEPSSSSARDAAAPVAIAPPAAKLVVQPQVGSSLAPTDPWAVTVDRDRQPPQNFPGLDKADCVPEGPAGRRLRWLLRTKHLLRRGSSTKEKLSPWMETTLGGHTLKFRLKLVGVQTGGGRGHGSFGESEGRGKVQVLLDKQLPDDIPPLWVTIVPGFPRLEYMRGPEVGSWRGARPVFELAGGAEVNFNDAQEHDKYGDGRLAIVVDLTPEPIVA